MPVQILLAQAGAPVGSAGQARTDFVTGTPVQASAVGGPFAAYQWTFVAKAIDINGGARSSAAFSAPSASTTAVTPIDVAGEYLVQLAVDSGQGLGATADDVARTIFYAGTVGGTAATGPLSSDPAEMPQQFPAFREQLEDNTADAVDGGGNVEGWARKLLRVWAVIARIYNGKSWAWARVAQTGSGASVVQAFNVASVARTGVGTASVTFSRSLGTGNYAVVATARGVAGSVAVTAESSTGFSVERGDVGGALVDADWTFDVRRQTS